MVAKAQLNADGGNHDAAADVQTLLNEIDNLKCQLKYLRDWNAWLWDLSRLPGECLSATEKVVALDLHRQALNWKSSGLTTPQPIWIEGRAQLVGVSADTYGKALKDALAPMGIIHRTLRQDPETGHRKVLIEVDESFWSPETWKRSEPRNHGGERKKCPSCDSAKIRSITWVCEMCGEVHGWHQPPAA